MYAHTCVCESTITQCVMMRKNTKFYIFLFDNYGHICVCKNTITQCVMMQMKELTHIYIFIVRIGCDTAHTQPIIKVKRIYAARGQACCQSEGLVHLSLHSLRHLSRSLRRRDFFGCVPDFVVCSPGILCDAASGSGAPDLIM